MKIKINEKGYMLVEIILATALAFGIAFLLINFTNLIYNLNYKIFLQYFSINF